MEMVECPGCKGIGTNSLTEIDFHTREEKGSTTFSCVTCHGSKEVTAEYKATYDKVWGSESWCQCEPEDPKAIPDWKFYNDGQHPELHKHHYRCKECGKITQVG